MFSFSGNRNTSAKLAPGSQPTSAAKTIINGFSFHY